MTDLGELKQRVDQAVEELAVAQNARHLQHDSLVQLLADLEVKFDARHEELVYCHSRIADLEKANDQLGDLLNTVVQLIESGSVQNPDDPIFRASKMAADLVTLCAHSPVEQITDGRNDESEPRLVTVEAELIEDRPAIPEPQHTGFNPEPAAQASPEPTGPIHADSELQVEFVETEVPTPETPSAAIETPTMADRGQIGFDAAAPAAAVAAGRYEDASQEELDVELLLDDNLDDPSLPQALLLAAKAAKMDPDEMVGRLADVSAAVEAARRGDTAITADQDDRQELDIPGIETVVDFDIIDRPEESSLGGSDDLAGDADAGETDIKALMARIQEAAEKARARADAEPEGEPALAPSQAPGKTGTS